MKNKLLAILLTPLLFLSVASNIYAADNTNTSTNNELVAPSLDQSTFNRGSASVNGVSITPLLTTLNLSKGVKDQERIQLYNYSSKPVTVNFQFAKFVAANAYGQAQFSDITNGKYDDGNVSITIQSGITLPVKQYTAIPVNISINPNAFPGEYFVGLFATVAAGSIPANGAAVNSSVGSMYLITIGGNAKETGYIKSFTSSSFFNTSLPITFTTNFVNTGNVHLIPQGQIIITDMFGRTVTAINVNNEHHIVLPVGVNDRIFTDSWNSKGFYLGRYTATLYLTYGSKTISTQYSTITFWIIPQYIVVVGVLIILLLIAWLVARRLRHRI